MTLLWTNRKMKGINALFNGHYVNPKVLYVMCFGKIPCVAFIGNLDAAKAFAHVKTKLGKELKTTYQHYYYDWDEKKTLFNNTLFVLSDNRIIEVGNDWAQIFHSSGQYNWAHQLLLAMSGFRKEEKKRNTIGFVKHPESLQ